MERSHRLLRCDATALPEPERSAHFILARRLFGQAEERVAMADGYRHRLPADVLGEIAQFILNERRCCPFLTFGLTIPADGNAVWLTMTGPPGTRAVLDHELSLIEEA